MVRDMTDFQEQRLIIILADISGYTRFMIENQISAIHGQIIINTLIETLLSEIDIPLKLQEIEGDAVFLYAAHPGNDEDWDDVLVQVRIKLIRFFDVFIEGMAAAAESTICGCAICANAHDPSLKIVVHSGTAIFHSIGERAQVSGTDVIIAHRLLKNSVPGHEYLLMSADAYEDLGRVMDLDFIEGEEEYSEIGIVKTYVHPMSEAVQKAYDALYEKGSMALALRGAQYVVWGIAGMFRAIPDQIFNPTTNSSWFGRVSFSALFAILSPIFFLAGMVLIPVSLFNKRRIRTEGS